MENGVILYQCPVSERDMHSLEELTYATFCFVLMTRDRTAGCEYEPSLSLPP